MRKNLILKRDQKKLAAKSCSDILFHVTILYLLDGYTVSDVVMFWRDTPVVGVEDAELPQVTSQMFPSLFIYLFNQIKNIAVYNLGPY